MRVEFESAIEYAGRLEKISWQKAQHLEWTRGEAAPLPSKARKLVGGGCFCFREWVGFDERNVHEMLRDEPDLKFIGADDVAHEEIVRAVVAGFRSLLGH